MIETILTIPEGDAGELPVTLVNENGAPTDLSPYDQIQVIVKASRATADADAMFVLDTADLSITLGDPTAGIATLVVTGAQTATAGQYRWRMIGLYADEQHTLAAGPFIVADV